MTLLQSFKSIELSVDMCLMFPPQYKNYVIVNLSDKPPTWVLLKAVHKNILKFIARALCFKRRKIWA